MPRVHREDLARLGAKLVHQLLQVLLELELDARQLGVVQVDQPVDDEQVRAQRHLVLLLRVLEVAVEHLDDRILAVDLALVVLRDDLDLLAQVLHLDQTHQLAPLVEDLQPVGRARNFSSSRLPSLSSFFRISLAAARLLLLLHPLDLHPQVGLRV